jgi:hypothetical protein
MPYIVQEWRDKLDPSINALSDKFLEFGGETDVTKSYTKSFRRIVFNIVYHVFDPASVKHPSEDNFNCVESFECLHKEIIDAINDLKNVFTNMEEFPENRGGILNYTLTRLCINFTGNPRYGKINSIAGILRVVCNDVLRFCNMADEDELYDVVGALDCTKDEMYRRLTSPYEDKKIEENGDVF